jgi:hypothetical protein
MEEIDGRLVETKSPVDFKSMTTEDKRSQEDRINALIEACQLKPDGEGFYIIDDSAVSELLMIAESFGHDPMWVYHRANKNLHAVNTPLLHAIARVKGYAPGWAWHKKKELRKRNSGIEKIVNYG